MKSHKTKNLNLDERLTIEKGIFNNISKRAIANSIGKSESTIGKEIALHRFLSYNSSLKLECENYKHCKFKRNCNLNCPDYVQFKCSRRDRSPGACNGCNNYRSCRFSKYRYDAVKANTDYKNLLVSSRQGFDLTEEEAKKISDIVCPLLLKGQSPYAIITNHPELGISEKTLYTYIEADLFKSANVSVMQLRRYVSRKVPKKKAQEYKKRADRSYLKGRTYSDYLAFIKENPNAPVIEMDTVYNDISNGPFIQTFKFIDYGFLFAIYSTTKTQEDMVKGFETLYNLLGDQLFKKYIILTKTDRGPEFECAEKFEFAPDGTKRCLVYYCDPMASHQKGSLENNHEELRYFFPKEKDLYKLGLTSQENLNIVLSHINSYSKEKLKGKSAFEYLKFFAPDLYQKFVDFGFKEIPHDDVTLNNSVLKHVN